MPRFIAFGSDWSSQWDSYAAAAAAVRAHGYGSVYDAVALGDVLQGSQPPPNVGSLSDEQAVYNRWGWAFTAAQLPNVPTGIRPIGHIDVHGDLEADDLWQNIVMWQRTGQQGYYDLAASWAAYYKNTYLTDYQADLSGFFGDHTFGWGLIAWARIVNDVSYLAAANAICDAVQSAFASFGAGVLAGFYSLRGPGRQIKLATALGRIDFATQIWTHLRDGGRWDERTINGVSVGFFKEDNSEFPWSVGIASGAFSSFEFAVLHDGLCDYYDATQDPEVLRRVKLMSSWAKAYGLEPTALHTGHWIIVDYPAVNQFLHTGVSTTELLDPFYTCTLIDVLVRGYQFTGDLSYLDRAKLTWDRCSKGVYGDSYPYTNRAPDNQVGHFMNSQMLSGGLYYVADGELTYGKLLFVAEEGTTPPPPPPPPSSGTDTWKLLPNSSLRSLMQSLVGNPPGYLVSPGSDGNSYPMDNLVQDWNGGCIDTKRGRLILPACGGHSSWFYNDVWAFDPNAGWSNLRRAFLPYMTLAMTDASGMVEYPDGSPSTVHTYDGVAYVPPLDKVFMIGGPGWNTTGRGPRARMFDLVTAQWAPSLTQNVYPSNGTCSAFDDVNGTVWFRTPGNLYEYDPVKDAWYRLASCNDPVTYSNQQYHTGVFVNGAMYMFGGNDCIRNVAGQGDTNLALTGVAIPYVAAPGVAWEPGLNKVVVWTGGSTVYLVDLTTLQVTTRSPSGDVPGAAQGLGTYKRFGRIAQGQYLLMTDLDHVYKLTLSVP